MRLSLNWTEVEGAKMSALNKLYLLLSAILLTIVVIFLVRLPSYIFTYTAYLLLTLLTTTLLTGFIFFLLLAKEYYLTKQAKRIDLQLRANKRRYKVVVDGFGMAHLINTQTDIIENLSAFPGTHHNGHWEEPHPAATQAWFALVAKKGVESPVQHLLANPTEQPINLLEVMTQPTQSYAIIGGQQQGKTYQAQLIAQHWQQQGVGVIVVGPKQDRGEWPGCRFYGAGFNWTEVSEGIERVRAEAMSRHQSTLSHKQHNVWPVFFDDWTKVRVELPDVAEQLIIDATTLYASVNIILYFILHLDTANAWGVGKIGAALKENFIKLRIKPFYSGGMIDRQRSTGLLVFPGDKEKREVQLLGGKVIVPDLVLQPTREEEHLLRLVEQGITSKKQLAESVWGKGKFGKYYNDKISGLLDKWGVGLE